MTRYAYIDPTRFFTELPTHDFDDSELEARALPLLAQAVEAGVYAPQTPQGRGSAVEEAAAPEVAVSDTPTAKETDRDDTSDSSA